MPEVILLKNNIVVTKIYNVDADAAVLSDVAEVGDVYDPINNTFSKLVLPARPEPKEEEPVDVNAKLAGV